MARKSSPPLYELISASRPERSVPSRPADDEPVLPASSAVSAIGPGRFIQFPVGYVFVAVAAVVIVVILAYMFGYSRAQQASRLVDEADVDPTLIAAGNGRLPRDPLDRTADPPRQPAERSSTPARPGGSGTAGTATNIPQQWGPVQPASDPRRSGLEYFVLATTREAGAVRLAEFCRERGLETYAVRLNNTQWQVIALPGFEPSERAGPRVREMREAINRIGDSWKNHERGATNLRDAYLAPYGR
ncbi:MAG TPA: hypothetical protein PK098_11730 [Phycisphaerales bacterium]|nr:hypothetical protein [Phycisphaerales bacterium]